MNTTPLIAYTIYRRYPDTGWAMWKRYKKHLGVSSANVSNRSREIAEFLVKLGLAE